MLSILIPCYNYNVYPLAKELHKQSTLCNIEFEIIIIDDCSVQILYDIEKINALSNVKVLRNKVNKGRSTTRNLLAKLASFNNLLFVDAGTYPKSKNFISYYLSQLNQKIVIGGMAPESNPPHKPYKLRWLYTKKRETCCDEKKIIRQIYTSANFLIKKNIIEAFPFDESLKRYGFEDYIFFKTIELNDYSFKFVKNPVIHDSKEDAKTFLKKTEQGLLNLIKLKKEKNKLIENVKIIKWYKKISLLGLNIIVASLFKLFKPLLIKNFESSNPSLLLFDFYKLGFLCSIISKK